jgi:hypothetical protein
MKAIKRKKFKDGLIILFSQKNHIRMNNFHINYFGNIRMIGREGTSRDLDFCIEYFNKIIKNETEYGKYRTLPNM